MKIEFRAHYWPNTPNLREIKIVVDDKVICSSFMNADEIHEMAINLSTEADNLFKVEETMENSND